MQTSYGEHHWTPPKGHVDAGETDMQTALRETEEEAGLLASDLKIFENIKQEIVYQVQGKPKTVVYFLAEILKPDKTIRLSDEHQAYKWLPLEEACTLAKYVEMQKLYMVEKWERNFINIFFLVLFFSFFFFNYKILLPFVQHVIPS
ncbi:hypothetical protein KM043_004636 [Ampulex compressa]|nr:hypothetical protein KM043_004636 [Ampulex compressa]